MLDMLMTRPQPRSAISSMNCLVTTKTLVRSVLITSSQASLVSLLNDLSRVMPALLTRMSMVPKSRLTSAHIASTSFSSATLCA